MAIFVVQGPIHISNLTKQQWLMQRQFGVLMTDSLLPCIELVAFNVLLVWTGTVDLLL